MIRLVFLGRLAELAGAGELELATSAAISIESILSKLNRPLAEALGDDRIKLAINGVLAARGGLLVSPGDELAFLPPVSGG